MSLQGSVKFHPKYWCVNPAHWLMHRHVQMPGKQLWHHHHHHEGEGGGEQESSGEWREWTESCFKHTHHLFCGRYVTANMLSLFYPLWLLPLLCQGGYIVPIPWLLELNWSPPPLLLCSLFFHYSFPVHLLCLSRASMSPLYPALCWLVSCSPSQVASLLTLAGGARKWNKASILTWWNSLYSCNECQTCFCPSYGQKILIGIRARAFCSHLTIYIWHEQPGDL